MRNILFFSAALCFLASCSGAKRCTPALCAGCCDATDECRGGIEASACGTNGAACSVCATGQVCALNVCAQAPVVDSGVADAGAVDAGMLCGRTPTTCSDKAIMSLDFKSTMAPGLISTTAIDGGFLSTIDSRAGGFNPTEGYVYARFTATGLEKVAISDMTAIDSMDWDIAFKRYIVRINSGDSGPSCVTAAPASVPFEDLATLPAGLLFDVDDFLGDAPTCMFHDDGTGLTSSPLTALASYYDYPASCVRMTGKAFVLRTRANTLFKLNFQTYYSTEAAQQACQTTGSSNMAPGGTVRLRWAPLAQ